MVEKEKSLRGKTMKNAAMEEEIKKAEIEALQALTEARVNEKMSSTTSKDTEKTQSKILKRTRRLLSIGEKRRTLKGKHQSSTTAFTTTLKQQRKPRVKDWATKNLNQQLEMVQHEESGTF